MLQLKFIKFNEVLLNNVPDIIIIVYFSIIIVFSYNHSILFYVLSWFTFTLSNELVYLLGFFQLPRGLEEAQQVLDLGRETDLLTAMMEGSR